MNVALWFEVVLDLVTVSKFWIPLEVYWSEKKQEN